MKKSLEKSENVLKEKHKKALKNLHKKDTHVYNNCYERSDNLVRNVFAHIAHIGNWYGRIKIKMEYQGISKGIKLSSHSVQPSLPHDGANRSLTENTRLEGATSQQAKW